MGECFLCRRSGGNSTSTIEVTASPGARVELAAVRWENTRVAMEMDGVHTFRNVEPGTWYLVAHDDTGGWKEKELTIREEEQRLLYKITLFYFDAPIRVNYPAGALCTCACGDELLTAPDDSGSWTVAVKHPGDWTLTIAKNGETRSRVISVTEETEQTVDIRFDLTVFDLGWGDGKRGGMETAVYRPGEMDAPKPTVTYDGAGYLTLNRDEWDGAFCAYTNEEFDLTDYKTLKCTTGNLGSGDAIYLGIGGTSVNPNRKIALTASNTQYTLDLTGVSGRKRIGFYSAPFEEDVDRKWRNRKIKSIVLTV